MLAETLVLAAAGGVLGTMCAVWMQQVILEFLQMDLPGFGEARLSLPMLGVAFAVSLVVGLLAGIYPALIGTRADLTENLKAGSRTTAGLGTGFRSTLVVGQVALSVVLLIGSGLLIRSFFSVRSVDPGFVPGNLITAEIELSGSRYAEQEQRIRFFADLLDETRRVPGVTAAGLINNLPICSPRNVFHAYVPDDPEHDRSVFLRAVLPGYFDAMGIQLLSGRDFEDQDAVDASAAVVINSATARAFFGEASPLGQQIVLDYFGVPEPAEIVGVVDDVRMSGLNVAPGLALYLPYPQAAYRRMQIAVRTTGEPATVASALRASVRSLDRDVPVAGIVAMDDGKTCFFLISTDVCTILPALYDATCKMLTEQLGIQSQQVWWATTHTHSAPEVGPTSLAKSFKKVLGDRFSHEPNTEFTKLLQQRLIEGIKRAQQQLVPARLGIGSGQAMANVNRRGRNAEGKVVLGVDPDGPVDRQIGLLRLERLDGTLIALVANYPIHATVLGARNCLISGDVAGIVSQYVENKSGAPMLFVNGAEGNVAPVYSVRPNFASSHIEEFEGLLGKDFINILSEEKADGFDHGLITREFLKQNITGHTGSFYVCGPPPMMETVPDQLSGLGIPESSIVKEGM